MIESFLQNLYVRVCGLLIIIALSSCKLYTNNTNDTNNTSPAKSGAPFITKIKPIVFLIKDIDDVKNYSDRFKINKLDAKCYLFSKQDLENKNLNAEQFCIVNYLDTQLSLQDIQIIKETLLSDTTVPINPEMTW